jgi:hypothetical protein
MTEHNIIDTVVEKLNKYPNIKFDKKSDSELEIFCRNDKGFELQTVISKPKRRPCNRKTDNKTTRLLTSKLTFGRQKLG